MVVEQATTQIINKTGELCNCNVAAKQSKSRGLVGCHQELLAEKRDNIVAVPLAVAAVGSGVVWCCKQLRIESEQVINSAVPQAEIVPAFVTCSLN